MRNGFKLKTKVGRYIVVTSDYYYDVAFFTTTTKHGWDYPLGKYYAYTIHKNKLRAIMYHWQIVREIRETETNLLRYKIRRALSSRLPLLSSAAPLLSSPLLSPLAYERLAGWGFG